MGRSEGKDRLRGMLLGGGDANIVRVNRSVIKGELKKKIEKKLFIFQKRNVFSRQKFYEGIIDDLAKLNKEDLLVDPVFLEILKQENNFLKRDIDISLDQKTLKKLAPDFINSLSSGQTPHLGRQFLTSDQIDQEYKKNLLNNYFDKLAKIATNQDSLYSFAVNNLWPLSRDNQEFSEEIVTRLADQIAAPGSCHVGTVISGLPLEQLLFYKELEKEQLIKKLTDFFNSDDCTYVALEEVVDTAKKEAALSATTIKAIIHPDDFDKTRAEEIYQAPHNLLASLKEVLEERGVKKDQGVYFAKNIHHLLGGEDPARIDNLTGIEKLDPIDVYLVLKRVIDSGNTKPGSFYNYRSVFFDELEAAI